MIRASMLRDVIRLQRIAGEGDGAFADLPTNARTRARVEELGDGRVRLVLRWRADLRTANDIEQGMRVVVETQDDRALDVDSVVPAELGVETHLFAHDVIVDTPVLSTGGRRLTTWP